MSDCTAAGSLLQKLIQKNRATRLRRYFRDVATASLAASVIAVGAAGCASEWPENNAGEFEPATCEGTAWQAADGLNLASGYTYLGVYQANNDFFGGPSPDEIYVTLIDEIGTVCGDAADVTLCESAVDSGAMPGRYVLVTEGDEVRHYRSKDEVMTLLGTIDTGQEALLVAWMDGMNISCGDLSRTAVREVEGGYEVVVTDTEGGCGDVFVERRYRIHIDATGAATELEVEELRREDMTDCAIGRRPNGMLPREKERIDNPLGDYFARITYLEASAVSAFEILTRELAAHDAPDDILADVRRATEDEVRHAFVMGLIAERLGGTPEPAHVETRPNRSLYEIALDNACEGCVRETYGALLGTYQSISTPDTQVAEAMTMVSEDETFHAEVSWKIHDWIMPQLTEDERRRIDDAQREAVTKLREDVRSQPEAAIARFAGLPGPEQAVALVDRLAEDIWS